MATQQPGSTPGGIQSGTPQAHTPTGPQAVQPASNTLEATRLAFAQGAFANIQELNRTMDQKANNLLASVALLTAALGILAAGAIDTTPQDNWQCLFRGAGVVLLLLYLLVAFNVIYVATKVYQARSHSLRPDTTAPAMLFPLMLLEGYSTNGKPDEVAYLNRLMTLEHREILHDYSNQIMEVANIYKVKQSQINVALERFRWLSILWVVAMLVLVLIIVWLR